MQKIRELLAADASVISVEVRVAGERLFTFDR